MMLLGLGALTLQGYAQATAAAPASTVASMIKPQGLNLAQKGERSS